MSRAAQAASDTQSICRGQVFIRVGHGANHIPELISPPCIFRMGRGIEPQCEVHPAVGRAESGNSAKPRVAS